MTCFTERLQTSFTLRRERSERWSRVSDAMFRYSAFCMPAEFDFGAGRMDARSMSLVCQKISASS